MNKNGNSKGYMGSLKHGLMMILCCLLPIIIVSGISLLGVKDKGISSLAYLICPIGMGIMMFTMMKQDKGGACHGENKNNTSKENERIENLK